MIFVEFSLLIELQTLARVLPKELASCGGFVWGETLQAVCGSSSAKDANSSRSAVIPSQCWRAARLGGGGEGGICVYYLLSGCYFMYCQF